MVRWVMAGIVAAASFMGGVVFGYIVGFTDPDATSRWYVRYPVPLLKASQRAPADASAHRGWWSTQ